MSEIPMYPNDDCSHDERDRIGGCLACERRYQDRIAELETSIPHVRNSAMATLVDLVRARCREAVPQWAPELREALRRLDGAEVTPPSVSDRPTGKELDSEGKLYSCSGCGRVAGSTAEIRHETTCNPQGRWYGEAGKSRSVLRREAAQRGEAPPDLTGYRSSEAVGATWSKSIRAAESFVEEWAPDRPELAVPLAEELSDAYNAGYRAAHTLSPEAQEALLAIATPAVPVETFITGATDTRSNEAEARAGDITITTPRGRTYTQGECLCIITAGCAEHGGDKRTDNPVAAEVESRIAASTRIQTRERCAQELYDLARWCREKGFAARASHTESAARRLQGVDDDGNVVARHYADANAVIDYVCSGCGADGPTLDAIEHRRDCQPPGRWFAERRENYGSKPLPSGGMRSDSPLPVVTADLPSEERPK